MYRLNGRDVDVDVDVLLSLSLCLNLKCETLSSSVPHTFSSVSPHCSFNRRLQPICPSPSGAVNRCQFCSLTVRRHLPPSQGQQLPIDPTTSFSITIAIQIHPKARKHWHIHQSQPIHPNDCHGKHTVVVNHISTYQTFRHRNKHHAALH